MDQQEIIGLLLLITVLASYINHKFIKLPKSIGLTVVTLFFTIMVTILGEIFVDVNALAGAFVDDLGFNEHFLHGMLSFLLFAGALHVNPEDLSQFKLDVLALSTVSVLISTIFIGYLTFWMVTLLGVKLPLYYCFAFGALISPTDAVAVLGVLKQAKVPKALEMKISGEALFNDGAGIVLFFISMGLATGEEKAVHITEVLRYFVQEGLGGVLVGIILGWLTTKAMNALDDHEVVIMLTLALVTAGYSVATLVLNVSGPISMVVAGLIVGTSLKRHASKANTLQRVDDFWELVDALLNAILFVLIGIEFMRINFDLSSTLAAVGAILITIVSRWVSIAMPVVFLRKQRDYPPGVMALMTWAGLRGGVSIALALSIGGKYHDIIVSITYGVVLFSIMVQGLTMNNLATRMLGQRTKV